MKPWQRKPVGIPNRNPDTLTAPATPLDAPALRSEHAQPLAPVESGLTLAQRVSGLENKAHYDGEFIAKLRAELTIAGQCIDTLTARLGALSDKVESGAGNSQPVADNPPGV